MICTIRNIPLLKPDCGEIQDDSKATYYPKRTPEDGKIDWSISALEIEHSIKAVTKPYPGAFTFLDLAK